MILEVFLFSIKPEDYVRKHVLVRYRHYASRPCLCVSGFLASALGELWTKLISVLPLGLFLADAPADPQYTVDLFLLGQSPSFSSICTVWIIQGESRVEGSYAHYCSSNARTQTEGMEAKVGCLCLSVNLTHS